MSKDPIILKGMHEGPTSLILVGVHGNERCGLNALEKILPTLSIENGTVIFMYGNPEAINENKRCLESDLNRMFVSKDKLNKNVSKSLEYLRSREIMKYMEEADVLLDIHASNSSISKPFIICEENGNEIANYLGIETVVYGFSNIEPGGTDGYMNLSGKIGICVECGYTKDPLSDIIAENSIMNFLKKRAHISGTVEPTNIELLRVTNLYETKTDSFRLEKKFADFERISANQKIGIDGSKEVISEKDGFILFAHNTDHINAEAFVIGEYL